MAKVKTLQMELTRKKDTRNGKKHFNSSSGASPSGALYFTAQQLKDMGGDDESTVEVTIRVKK